MEEDKQYYLAIGDNIADNPYLKEHKNISTYNIY